MFTRRYVYVIINMVISFIQLNVEMILASEDNSSYQVNQISSTLDYLEDRINKQEVKRKLLKCTGQNRIYRIRYLFQFNIPIPVYQEKTKEISNILYEWDKSPG